MEMLNERRRIKSKHIMVLAVSFLCLFLAGTAAATNGTTFPVDEAGIAAYVKVNDSINLQVVMDIYPYIDVVNETYVIGRVQNADGIYTHLYVGADGWVIPYCHKTEHVSRIVRWNRSSPSDPTPETVAAMNTFEESISRVCAYLGVDYETIKPNIKYYDFEHPNATNMIIALDIAQGGSDYFQLWIPSESIVIVNESSWSHYTDHASRLYLDGSVINYLSAAGTSFGTRSLSPDSAPVVSVDNVYSYSSDTSGVGWVLVYTKKP